MKKNSEMCVKVGIIQINTKKLDIDYNFKKSIELIRKSAKKGAQIVCTQECMLDGYSFDTPEFQKEPLKYTISLSDSKLISSYENLARELGIHIIIGLSERELINKEWIFHNSAVLFSPKDGMIGKYSKVHSTFGNLEATFYKHGEEFSVFPIKIGDLEFKIGIMICYDRQMPESARILRIRGASIIFNPAATGNFARRWNSRLIQTRAYENKCYIVSVNHAATRINGLSFVANPKGKIIKRCYRWECIKNVLIDLELVETNKKHINTRRPTIYKGLLE